ncbi:hypothetical protein N1E52_26685 [Pseudomonas aeruginosa]|nr:hypothetical protein [Pseudomonas aeruginosa]
MSNEDWNELDESYRSALSGALETAHPAVEQAGGDERAAFEAAASKLGIYTCNFERYTEETAAHENRINARVEDPVRAGDYRSATLQDCWKVWQEARAALAQHSPAPTLRAAIDIANDRFEAPVAKWGTDLAGEEERPEIEEVSEFEREDIARSAFETAMADGISLDSFLSLSNTLAARYERIVGALRFERQQMDRAFTACINERDAANARLHEVATACATAEQERDVALARVAELDKQCRDDVARALGLRPSQERGFAWSYLLASIKSCVKASEDAAQAQHSVPAYVSYTTRPAESLAGIALRQLKDESRWVEIRDINAHTFPDMQSHSYYPAGTVIKLPAAAPGKEVGHE